VEKSSYFPSQKIKFFFDRSKKVRFRQLGIKGKTRFFDRQCEKEIGIENGIGIEKDNEK
jgi:hypothetical protein